MPAPSMLPCMLYDDVLRWGRGIKLSCHGHKQQPHKWLCSCWPHPFHQRSRFTQTAVASCQPGSCQGSFHVHFLLMALALTLQEPRDTLPSLKQGVTPADTKLTIRHGLFGNKVPMQVRKPAQARISCLLDPLGHK